MNTSWLVFPLSRDAEHGLVSAVDPENSTFMVTLRVSDRDFDDLDTWIESEGYRSDWVYSILRGGKVLRRWVKAKWGLPRPFEWTFHDPVEVMRPGSRAGGAGGI